MKQKLLTLLLFVMALYMVFPSGGDYDDDEETTSFGAYSVDTDFSSDNFYASA